MAYVETRGGRGRFLDSPVTVVTICQNEGKIIVDTVSAPTIKAQLGNKILLSVKRGATVTKIDSDFKVR